MKKTSLFRLISGAAALALSFVPANAHSAPGDLYVSNSTAGAIYKFTSTGDQSTFASGLSGPDGLAFDRAGNLFVAEESGTILKFTPSAV